MTLLWALLALGAVYLVAAYVVVPALWRREEERHPALADAARVTHTPEGIPGDPLNVALVGGEHNLVRAMLRAGWSPADPITLESALRIAASTVLHRPYPDAPVSPLYLFGREEDLAFEKPVGGDARRRHHVRLWRASQLDVRGHPLWLGAATFDTGVGLSHTTGQITHHISPDVDVERETLLADLHGAGCLVRVKYIYGFHEKPDGRNGGGDPFRTDGALAIGELAAAAASVDPASC